jgi:signal peptidase I
VSTTVAGNRSSRSNRVKAVVTVVAGGLAVLFLAAALSWRITGGRWMIVSTPSMGQAAPVGTLVLTRPTEVSHLHVGDVISFHPPGLANRTYTHRIISIGADGVHTRGDINGAADPWPLHNENIVGKVVGRWWGIGWLLRGLPIIVIGIAIVWAATRYYASDRWRVPLRIVGYAAVVSLAGFLVKPFVRVVVIASNGDSSGAHASIVSTGLLPIRVSASGGNSADLIAGQVGRVTAQANSSGRYHLDSGLHMGWPWWMVIILLCASPLLYSLVVGLSPLPEPADSDPEPVAA